jgi:oxygen-independent coproporphyrinogen-3 oxidase
VPFSVDLICGVPGQSHASWERTLAEAVATGAGHVSAYALTVEEGTPLARSVATGRVAAPDPDVAAEMMLRAEETFAAAGLARYEIANYARPGEAARHNVGYWTGVPYLGIGPSAASMVPAGAGGRERFVMNATLADFLERGWAAEPDEREVLTAEEAAREDAMLGLRLSAGITDALVGRAGAIAALRELADAGLVRHESGRWRLTQRGWLLGNEVFERVWLG